MIILDDFKVKISLNDVAKIISRKTTEEVSPSLIAIYQKYIDMALDLFQPLVIYDVFAIKSIEKNKVTLTETYFESALLKQFVKGADELVFACCTIGKQLEEKVDQLSRLGKNLDAYVLDAIGAIATDLLSILVYERSKKLAIANGVMTGPPCYPGLNDWAVEDLAKIFSLLNPEKIGVTLTKAFTMQPCKSLTFAVGMGDRMKEEDVRKQCKVCSFRNSCWLKEL